MPWEQRHLIKYKQLVLIDWQKLLSKEYGRNSKETADDNAKIITMYKAVKHLKATGDVKFLRKVFKKSSFHE